MIPEEALQIVLSQTEQHSSPSSDPPCATRRHPGRKAGPQGQRHQIGELNLEYSSAFASRLSLLPALCPAFHNTP